jgi:hypothetical protein
MRVLTKHQTNPANKQLKVEVLDEPGHGGACHIYRISGGDGIDITLGFQDGPILEAGVNGITHEALLAILIDRLEGFQSGPYACGENNYALSRLAMALDMLARRTEDRIARGVEGTHEL